MHRARSGKELGRCDSSSRPTAIRSTLDVDDRSPDGGASSTQGRAGSTETAASRSPDLWRSSRAGFSTEDVWVGIVTTVPGEMSAWHHHGDHETYAYVVSGLKRIEYGPGGTQSLIAGPDDFIHLPKGLMHREGNPSGELSRSIAFRLGIGPATINDQRRRAAVSGSTGDVRTTIRRGELPAPLAEDARSRV